MWVFFLQSHSEIEVWMTFLRNRHITWNITGGWSIMWIFQFSASLLFLCLYLQIPSASHKRCRGWVVRAKCSGYLCGWGLGARGQEMQGRAVLFYMLFFILDMSELSRSSGMGFFFFVLKESSFLLLFSHRLSHCGFCKRILN